ncbi:protein O-glucosyltransferase 2 [Nasonia vitripennis]|uniref:Glycosyl transferase CAP10 domain-containing protein n=1 Tax=Nasonia vitripennis TaxID=7425 RepID=A0A7M7GDG1_NASVI|nr:protein O-glucosyltransferase 2 [Nasonia vitripennis]
MPSFILICCLLMTTFFRNTFTQTHAVKGSNVDAKKTIVWGPGLSPENITLRARYIFLQLVDKEGKNITESLGKSIISAQIKGETVQSTPCHIWTQIFDCKDGSYIVRYRTYNTCFNLHIVLQVKNEKLPLKHSQVMGPVYEEECNCPHSSLDAWLHQNNCRQNYTQILQDLKLFPTVNFDSLRNEIIDRYNKPNSVSICHYVIKSNQIYRNCYGQHVGFKIFSDAILLSLARKINLPDVEFFMNLGDWPLVPKNKEIHPIFSWCGSDDSYDIVLPTYDITQSSMEAMGRVMLDMLSVQGSTTDPWNKKIEKMFWRGRDARRERLDLIDIARKHPELFNASITNFFFFRDEIEKYGPEQKHVSFFEFFKYKYQLNIDGVVAAYRFPYLLVGDSVVFKQDSKYYEFFYKDLEAGKHFIPIKSDLSDLVQKLEWARENDDQVYKISKEARQYARDNLMPQDVFCYHVNLINEWSKRIKSQVQVLPKMEQVSQPEHECECANNVKDGKDEL